MRLYFPVDLTGNSIMIEKLVLGEIWTGDLPIFNPDALTSVPSRQALITVLLPAYHCRQWLYVSPEVKGLKHRCAYGPGYHIIWHQQDNDIVSVDAIFAAVVDLARKFCKLSEVKIQLQLIKFPTSKVSSLIHSWLFVHSVSLQYPWIDKCLTVTGWCRPLFSK